MLVRRAGGIGGLTKIINRGVGYFNICPHVMKF